MAVTSDTLRLAAGVKLAIGTEVDAATADLVRAWAAAWNVLLPVWADAIREASEQVYDGDTTWRAWARQERARKALHATAVQMQALAEQAGVTITGHLPAILDITTTGHDAGIRTQSPPGVTVTYTRVDPDALEAVVKRTTKQITARTKPISAEATRAIKQGLVQGVAEGMNPRNAARIMLERTRGGFAGGLTRATTIARTEMLDAHRAAALKADEAAADVLQGWQWQATLSTRTCPACLAKHGTVHPLSEPGPIDHPNGRCTRLPILKPWKDLGFAIPEPEPVVPDARAWFDALPEADQLRVMGQDRLALLKSGHIEWADLATVRANPDWRPSIQITPVRDLTRRAAA